MMRPLNRLLLGSLLTGLSAVASGLPAPPTNSLAELQKLASIQHQWITSISVTGSVLAAESESGWVVLQDDSAAVLLQLPHLDPDVGPGDRLAIEGTNVTLTADAAGILVGTAPVVNLDGLHSPVSRAGRVFLSAGWQPTRLDWFNGEASGELEVSYEGPGVSLQRIPDQALRRGPPKSPADENIFPGLNFSTYFGTNWTALPDFPSLTSKATGVTPNFDVGRCSQTPSSAMQFSGFLHIATPGIYAFHLKSDDGSRMFVGDPAVQCTVTKLERASSVPASKVLAEALSGHGQHEWIKLEGTVVFASRRGDQIEMQIIDRQQPVSVLVASAKHLAISDLVGRRVQIIGICESPDETRIPRIIVAGGDQFKLIDANQTSPIASSTLTTAAQVRGLQPDETRRQIRVAIRGVVTTATTGTCVLQDPTGPIFVRTNGSAWSNQPMIGEIWEVEGRTDPGEFSPVVIADRAVRSGKGSLPQPIHPDWEQLVNGSLDVELVELSGLVSETTSSEMTLLTPGGRIKIVSFHDLPLPYGTALLAPSQTLIGSLVHVQGVLFTCRDAVTQQLIPGRIILGDGLISVDETAPSNPFSVPTRHVEDLLHFTSHVSVLTRFKVKAQVLYARPPEYFLQDGENCLRALTKEPVPLAEGDLVEVVGFPQIGGPSPMLLEAEARKIGHAPRTAALRVDAAELTSEGFDANLVQVDAILLNDSLRLGEQVLELQAGRHHFLARRKTAQHSETPMGPGAQLRLTGVYVDTPSASNSALDGFQLLLNRSSDIVVLKSGPWLTPFRVVTAIAILVAGLTASLIWVALLRRTVAHRTVLLEAEIRARQQTEQRRLLEQERTRVAQDLHDDLGAGLAQIGLLGSLVQRPNTLPDRAKGLLCEITDKSREMVTVLDEIVWAMNPKHDAADSVSGYLCDYAQEFLSPTDIVCQFETDCTQGDLILNSIQRHQLFLAFKEALTNVVKHAQATQVWVQITATPQELNIIVEDNGKGLPWSLDVSKGNGTINMRARLAQLGGHCEIEPRPSGGTIVSFHLPKNIESFAQ